MVFLQRFGGALNLNPHFHALVLDGVYTQSPSKDAPPHFTPLPAPTDEEVVALTGKIERKVLSGLGLEGSYIDHAEQQGDPLPFESPLLKECYTASIPGRVGLGAKAGAYVHREGRLPNAPNARLRDQVVPKTKEGSVCRRVRKSPIPLEAASSEEKRRRYTFAELMRRVFDVGVLRCPHCQGKRKLVAMITEVPVIRAILDCLKLPLDPPVMAEARWPIGLFEHT